MRAPCPHSMPQLRHLHQTERPCKGVERAGRTPGAAEVLRCADRACSVWAASPVAVRLPRSAHSTIVCQWCEAHGRWGEHTPPLGAAHRRAPSLHVHQPSCRSSAGDGLDIVPVLLRLRSSVGLCHELHEVDRRRERARDFCHGVAREDACLGQHVRPNERVCQELHGTHDGTVQEDAGPSLLHHEGEQEVEHDARDDGLSQLGEFPAVVLALGHGDSLALERLGACGSCPSALGHGRLHGLGRGGRELHRDARLGVVLVVGQGVDGVLREGGAAEEEEGVGVEALARYLDVGGDLLVGAGEG
mmetsp:Transcript_23688/g.64287  ORF Transcript_23688/g.64287 Transcript_23688/m.64287 type:complete len:303 (+) Transcript_23688:218-1126(+)